MHGGHNSDKQAGWHLWVMAALLTPYIHDAIDALSRLRDVEESAKVR